MSKIKNPMHNKRKVCRNITVISDDELDSNVDGCKANPQVIRKGNFANFNENCNENGIEPGEIVSNITSKTVSSINISPFFGSPVSTVCVNERSVVAENSSIYDEDNVTPSKWSCLLPDYNSTQADGNPCDVLWDYASPDAVKYLKKRTSDDQSKMKEIIKHFKDVPYKDRLSKSPILQLHLLKASFHSMQHESSSTMISKKQKRQERETKRCQKTQEQTMQIIGKILSECGKTQDNDDYLEQGRELIFREADEEPSTVELQCRSEWDDDELFEDNSFIISATQDPDLYLGSHSLGNNGTTTSSVSGTLMVSGSVSLPSTVDAVPKPCNDDCSDPPNEHHDGHHVSVIHNDSNKSDRSDISYLRHSGCQESASLIDKHLLRTGGKPENGILATHHMEHSCPKCVAMKNMAHSTTDMPIVCYRQITDKVSSSSVTWCCARIGQLASPARSLVRLSEVTPFLSVCGNGDTVRRQRDGSACKSLFRSDTKSAAYVAVTSKQTPPSGTSLSNMADRSCSVLISALDVKTSEKNRSTACHSDSTASLSGLRSIVNVSSKPCFNRCLCLHKPCAHAGVSQIAGKVGRLRGDDNDAATSSSDANRPQAGTVNRNEPAVGSKIPFGAKSLLHLRVSPVDDFGEDFDDDCLASFCDSDSFSESPQCTKAGGRPNTDAKISATRVSSASQLRHCTVGADYERRRPVDSWTTSVCRSEGVTPRVDHQHDQRVLLTTAPISAVGRCCLTSACVSGVTVSSVVSQTGGKQTCVGLERRPRIWSPSEGINCSVDHAVDTADNIEFGTLVTCVQARVGLDDRRLWSRPAAMSSAATSLSCCRVPLCHPASDASAIFYSSQGRQVCTRTGDADDMMGDDDDDVLFESQILDFLDHIETQTSLKTHREELLVPFSSCQPAETTSSITFRCSQEEIERKRQAALQRKMLAKSRTS